MSGKSYQRLKRLLSVKKSLNFVLNIRLMLRNGRARSKLTRRPEWSLVTRVSPRRVAQRFLQPQWLGKLSLFLLRFIYPQVRRVRHCLIKFFIDGCLKLCCASPSVAAFANVAAMPTKKRKKVSARCCSSPLRKNVNSLTQENTRNQRIRMHPNDLHQPSSFMLTRHVQMSKPSFPGYITQKSSK